MPGLIALAKKKRHEAAEDNRQNDEQRNMLVIDKPGEHRWTGDEQEKHFADAPSFVCNGLHANLQDVKLKLKPSGWTRERPGRQVKGDLRGAAHFLGGRGLSRDRERSSESNRKET